MKINPTTKPQLEDGYTKIANQILEKLAYIRLSSYEWNVLMVVFRKTYGFNKKSDWISNSQLVKATGIQKSNVCRAIRKLKKKNIVVQTDNKLSFNKDYSSWLSKETTDKRLSKQTTRLSKETTPVVQIDNKGCLNRQIQKKKETITKETIQKKYISIYELNDTHFEVIAKKYNVPIGFVKSKYDDMINWHESTGKKKKDWVATLRNFVKKDAIERIDNAKKSNYKTAIDASSL